MFWCEQVLIKAKDKNGTNTAEEVEKPHWTLFKQTVQADQLAWKVEQRDQMLLLQ